MVRTQFSVAWRQPCSSLCLRTFRTVVTLQAAVLHPTVGVAVSLVNDDRALAPWASPSPPKERFIRTTRRIAGIAGQLTLTLVVQGLLVTAAAAQATPARFAITHVTVIDVERGGRLRDRTVLVEGHRITQVAPSASARTPAGITIVDGRGKYLIPGLWDMHVHALQSGRAPWMFPLLIATGVTGVRDTGAPLDSLLVYRPRVAAGDMLGPRIVGAGPILDGPPIQYPGVSRPVASPDQGRRIVDSLVIAGVNFIKTYDGLSRETFFAMAAEAKLRGISIIGHVPWAVSAFEASDAGLRSIEHLVRVPNMCIPDSLATVLDAEDEAMRARRPPIDPDSQQVRWINMDKREAAAFDERLCERAGARFARNGTWQVPTLEFHHRTGRRFQTTDTARTDSRLRYLPVRVVASWMRNRDSTLAHPFRAQEGDARYETYIRVARALVRGGASLLTGTDLGWPFVMPGFGVHGELQAFVRDVQLTPLQALRCATLGPAQFLGATDSLGTVAPGKLADLVLLDADPLANIRNTLRIRAVVANGRYLDRAALDALLSIAERADHDIDKSK